MFNSINRGANWAPATTGLTDPTVYTLAIDPANSSKLYAGCGTGLFKSIDGAANWTQVPSVPNNPGSGGQVRSKWATNRNSG